KNATGAMAVNAEKFMPFIINTCTKYNINTPARQLCFLAQVGHESMGLFYTEEIASGKAYEGKIKLSNTQPGDGIRFKGRGLIQITGRFNYTTLSNAFGADFINNPQLLGGKNITKCTPEQLKYSALSAGWFWDKEKLNTIADKINIQEPVDAGANHIHFKEITHRINGGYNGLDDRIHRYKAGVKFF
ncbi:MAG: glycoside hydrolase family 19 protein, partial [Parafilimonas sp.]